MANNPSTDANAMERAAWSPEGSVATVTLLQVVWHRRLLVLAATCGCILIAGIYLLFSTPIYSSTAQLYIESGGPSVYGESTPQAPQSDGFLNSQADVIQSTPVLTRALEAVQWRRLRTFQGVEADPAAWLQHSHEFRIAVEVVKKTDIVSVTMESPYPREAAAVVNAIADSYLAERARHDRFTGTEIVSALEKQRGDLERERARRVEAMIAFKREHGVTSFHDDKGNVALQRTALLSSQLNEVELQAWDLRAKSDAAHAALAQPGALASFVQAQQYKDRQSGDKEYDELRTQLVQETIALSTSSAVEGASNRRVKVLEAQIALLKLRIGEKERSIAQAYLADLAVQLSAAEQKERQLRLALADQQKRMAALDPLAAQYAKLESEADRLRKQCESLDNRISEVRVNSSAGPLNIQVVEEGRVPTSPVKPHKTLVLASSVPIGWLLGMGLALAGELRGSRLRSADEVRGALGLPVVATVPRINPRLSPVARGQMVYLDARSPVAEAYRSIRTSLNLGQASAARTLLVASPAPGDGKSTTASNLAIAFAQAGQRTLLIDCDLREPVQHLVFEVDNIVGLTTVIAGESKVRESIRPTRVAGLFVLPCGPVPSNPSELLAGKRFARLMAALGAHFDRVVIDSPPLTSLADGRILAAGADATLLVLRMNKSVRRLGVLALDGLEKVGANVVGAVANDVASGHGYHYYGAAWQYAARPRHLLLTDAAQNQGASAAGAAMPDVNDDASGESAGEGQESIIESRRRLAVEFVMEEPDWSADAPAPDSGAAHSKPSAETTPSGV